MLKKVNNQSLKIGEILCDNGLLSASLLQSVLEEQKSDSRKLGELLIEKGIVVESQVLTILSAMHNLPYISLENIHFDDQVFGLVSVALLRKHKIVPLGIEEGCLKVAINNCLDVLALQEIQDISGYPLKVSLASLLDIEKCLDKYEVSIHARKRDIKPKGVSDEDTPIIHCVETLIAQAINNRASDIHFEPAKDKMYVRFRIDGHLYSKTPIPKAIENKVLSRIKIIAGMDVANSREPQDGRLTIEKFKNYDIRVSTLPGILGENMVLRILDKTFTDFSFSSLGMSSPEEKIIKDLSAKPYGMLLVTGPTGAGKTTTLYAMLNYVKDVSKNIITVEDPVEYQVEGINQTAINNKTKYTFANAIRHILRHDPDIIMVGEIRDMETAEIGIRAALTGHFVLSTLHTNSASGAIMRLLDMNIEPFLIRSAVIGVVAQRLIRKLCSECKEAYVPSAEIKDMFCAEGFLVEDISLMKPVGCEACLQTGYSGRTAIYEMINITEDIRQIILKNPSERNINELASKQGTKSLRQSGLQRVLDQITSLEEVLNITIMDEQ